jgi:hypothetical protein
MCVAKQELKAVGGGGVFACRIGVGGVLVCVATRIFSI